MWFEAGRSIDEDVRQRFLPTVEAAVAGAFDDDPVWTADPHDRVCLILVLDQFTRHCYRDDPRFISGDLAAQRHVLAMFDDGDDAALEPHELLFLLTVLEHAEDRDIQARAMAETKRLAAIYPDDLGGLLEYVAQHHDIVQRFGRLPDRNVILGRASTDEEVAFLAKTSLPWFERQDL